MAVVGRTGLATAELQARLLSLEMTGEVARLQAEAPLNELDGNTIFGGGAKGYSDYPTLEAR